MAGDLSWSYVSLLLHCDGADGGTTFTDSGPGSHTVTPTNATTQIEQYKFGTASAYFDGSGDYLTIADHADFEFGSGEFTFEAWIRLTAYSPSYSGNYRAAIVSKDISTGRAFDFTVTGTSSSYTGLSLELFSDNLTGFTATTGSFAFSLNTWYHVAAVRIGTTATLYVNGTAIGSNTNNRTIQNVSTAVRVGALQYSGYEYYFPGYIDELRITRVGRYGGAFTPLTEAFPNGAGTEAASTQSNSSPGVLIPGYLIGTQSTQANPSSAGRLDVEEDLVAAASVQTNQSSTGILGLTFGLPISIENYYRVAIGIPIVFRVKSTATLPTLPITLGTYPVTATLPVVFRLRSTPTLPTLPVVIYGNQSATAGVGDFASWKPKCMINGVDMTAKLIGGGSVEFDEMAAPVASFSLLPTAGTVDPLAYVGQPVQIMLQFIEAGVVVAEYLVFTGLVSDPTWSVDDRVLTISATGDLQSQFDAMTKAQVSTQLASVSPTYSDVVFGDPDDLSGWEYAEALLSTVNAVVWQDSGGWIRVTSTLPKVSADFTYQDDGRFIGADIAYPSRLDLINKRTIEVAYRFSRLRQREVDVSFRPWQLLTPEVWLSCEGGWDLPQRSQIESAASGSGWYPTSDIDYVDVWENELYTTRSCAGVNFMAGLLIEDAVRADLCVGANWTAARRWNQTVTETATITVGASESQAVVGVLADNESYAYESEYQNEDWEDSLEDEAYSTSGMTQMASGDWKLDLDTDRTDFETAQTVAVAKARCDILKSHRGTTVTIQTTYQPQLDLSHTIEIDCAFVHCQGKVRRITHAWDIDTGDLTSEISVALYRHNGAGLVSDTAVAATTKAADPDETAPETILQLPMYIGGRDDKPPYDESWTGYIVNMPVYESASTDPVDRAQVWARSPDNPAVQTYPEGFHMVYPTIDATYADPGNAAATADFEVAVPEDLLELTA